MLNKDGEEKLCPFPCNEKSVAIKWKGGEGCSMICKDRRKKLAHSCLHEKCVAILARSRLDIRLKIYIFYILNTVMSNKGASASLFLLVFLCWRASLYVFWNYTIYSIYSVKIQWVRIWFVPHDLASYPCWVWVHFPWCSTLVTEPILHYMLRMISEQMSLDVDETVT